MPFYIGLLRVKLSTEQYIVQYTRTLRKPVRTRTVLVE